MSIPPNTMRYIFGIDYESIEYEIDTAFRLQEETHADAQEYPYWTLLETNQCACCPLKKATHSHCPAAIRMHSVLEKFKRYDSIERVQLRVETPQRNYEIDCDLQSGLNSMLGLQMASSGCPVVGQLRSMTSFHLPVSTFAETLYRVVSNYLTKQYFAYKSGESPDWDLKVLKDFFYTLEGLNQDFSDRIRTLEQKDAISNAMVMFFASSAVVAELIEDGLSEYKDFFTGESAEAPY